MNGKSNKNDRSNKKITLTGITRMIRMMIKIIGVMIKIVGMTRMIRGSRIIGVVKIVIERISFIRTTTIRIIRMIRKKSYLKVYGTISIIFAHRQQ